MSEGAPQSVTPIPEAEPEVAFATEIEPLTDQQGLEYFAVPVNSALIQPHLKFLKERLGERFDAATTAKGDRDGVGKYHLTVVKPPELKAFTDEQKENAAYWEWRRAKIYEYMRDPAHSMAVRVDVHGVRKIEGKEEKGEGGRTAYFAVVSSDDIEGLRTDLDEYLRIRTVEYNAARKEGEPEFAHVPLEPISAHITLGFEGGDVHRSGAKDLTADPV